MHSCQRRVIILGASNVAKKLHLVVRSACGVWGSPLDVMAAIGHGRSYGLTSTVMGRTLPGILQSELWEEWQARPAIPTAAVLTDIGNDLLFGARPATISGWVRQSFERLAPHCERMVMTELPLDSVSALGPRRFLLLRTVLFPRSRLQYRQALDMAAELNARLIELAADFGAVIVKPMAHWYGFDPIHIRRREGPGAWKMILSSSNVERSISGGQTASDANEGVRSGGAAPWHEAYRAILWRPRRRWMWGVEQTCPQPAGMLFDGTAVSLY